MKRSPYVKSYSDFFLREHILNREAAIETLVYPQ